MGELDWSEKLKCSDYLTTIKLSEKYTLIYHSLYGNLMKVNNKVVDLIKNIENYSSRIKESENIKNTILKLKDKKFIWYEDEDEREYIKEQLKKRPDDLKKGSLVGDVQLSVSNTCNMNCKYCFEKKFDNKVRDWSKKMDFQTAKDAIEKVLRLSEKNGKQSITVNFFGGEPLTNKKLIKDVLEYFGRNKTSDVIINYSIDTNGILLDEDIADIFKENDVLVNLSIDYISDEGYYRADGKTGFLFSNFDKSLSILHERKVKTCFLSVLSQDTYELFGTRLLDYAKEKGVLGNDVLVSFDLDFRDKYSPKEIVTKVVDYYMYARKLGIVVGGYWGSIIEQIEKENIRLLEGFKSCPAIGHRLSIEPNGDVFACKSSSKLFGNIKDISEILSSEGYLDYGMRAYQNARGCSGCVIEGFCSGSCLGMLEKNYSSIRKMDSFLCEIYKGITIEILRQKYK